MPETEAVEYPEEASTYPQEMQVTVAEDVLVDETVVENTVTQSEVESSELVETAETQISEETSEIQTGEEATEAAAEDTSECETESTGEAETEPELESEFETEFESEFESELEIETQTQEFESFDEAETEGYSADTLVEGNFQYQVSNNKATIVGYTGTESIVTIPATIGEYFVTAIGVQAFYQNQTICKCNICRRRRIHKGSTGKQYI